MPLRYQEIKKKNGKELDQNMMLEFNNKVSFTLPFNYILINWHVTQFKIQKVHSIKST